MPIEILPKSRWKSRKKNLTRFDFMFLGEAFKVDRLVFRYYKGVYGQKYFCLDFSTATVTIEF